MASNDRPTKRFLAEYFHDGAWWTVDVYAYDFDDAETRCRKLSFETSWRAQDDGPGDKRIVVAEFDNPFSERFR